MADRGRSCKRHLLYVGRWYIPMAFKMCKSIKKKPHSISKTKTHPKPKPNRDKTLSLLFLYIAKVRKYAAMAATAHANSTDYGFRVVHTINQNRNRNRNSRSRSSSTNTARGHPEVVRCQLIEYFGHTAALSGQKLFSPLILRLSLFTVLFLRRPAINRRAPCAHSPLRRRKRQKYLWMFRCLGVSCLRIQTIQSISRRSARLSITQQSKYLRASAAKQILLHMNLGAIAPRWPPLSQPTLLLLAWQSLLAFQGYRGYSYSTDTCPGACPTLSAHGFLIDLALVHRLQSLSFSMGSFAWLWSVEDRYAVETNEAAPFIKIECLSCLNNSLIREFVHKMDKPSQL